MAHEISEDALKELVAKTAGPFVAESKLPLEAADRKAFMDHELPTEILRV
jgi:hypothetical protein